MEDSHCKVAAIIGLVVEDGDPVAVGEIFLEHPEEDLVDVEVLAIPFFLFALIELPSKDGLVLKVYLRLFDGAPVFFP
jgi:hypothetical protein